jgi:RNA polymerase sigma-70 factor, ECF subfamily
MDDTSLLDVGGLLDRARRGVQDDRDRLFAASRSYLGLVARAQVENHLQAKVDASDLVQQTLLEAHRDFARFQGATEAEWLAWLRRILAHNTADFVRRFRGTAKRATSREVSPTAARSDHSTFTAFGEPADSIETPSQLMARRDDQLAIAAALETLTRDHREVIVLRNLERLSFEEVAQRMGRTRPAVQMLWMRAIKKLQEKMA